LSIKVVILNWPLKLSKLNAGMAFCPVADDIVAGIALNL